MLEAEKLNRWEGDKQQCEWAFVDGDGKTLDREVKYLAWGSVALYFNLQY